MNWLNDIDWQMLNGYLAVVIPLVTAVLVARMERVRYQTQLLKDSLNSEKKAFYFELINKLQKLFGDEWDEKVDGDIALSLRNLFEKSYYYASTNVLKSFGDLLQHAYVADLSDGTADTLRAKKLLAELIVQIRADLGHTRWISSESWLDILRINIKDINDYVTSSVGHKDRGRKTFPAMRFEGKKIK